MWNRHVRHYVDYPMQVSYRIFGFSLWDRARKRSGIQPVLRSVLAGRLALFAICAMTSANVAFAHEVWIAPHKPQFDIGARITADLRIGDNFVGNHLLYIPQQTERLAILSEAGMTDFVPRVGSRPVIDLDPGLLKGRAGHAMLIYQSADSYVHYMNQDKFFRFVEKKGAGEVREEHAGRGLPAGGFIERYKRFAKSSIMIGSPGAAGDAAINDRIIGMEVEFVLTDRSVLEDGSQRLKIQLRYQQTPLPNALLTLFTRAPGDEVTVTSFPSGPEGMVAVTALPGHDYLLDHVALRALDPQMDKNKAVWESLWASLTFSGK